MTLFEVALLTIVLSWIAYTLYEAFTKGFELKERKLNLEFDIQKLRYEFEDHFRTLKLAYEELERAFDLLEDSGKEQIESQLKVRLDEHVILAKELSELKDRVGEIQLSTQQLGDSFGSSTGYLSRG